MYCCTFYYIVWHLEFTVAKTAKCRQRRRCCLRSRLHPYRDLPAYHQLLHTTDDDKYLPQELVSTGARLFNDWRKPRGVSMIGLLRKRLLKRLLLTQNMQTKNAVKSSNTEANKTKTSALWTGSHAFVRTSCEQPASCRRFPRQNGTKSDKIILEPSKKRVLSRPVEVSKLAKTTLRHLRVDAADCCKIRRL